MGAVSHIQAGELRFAAWFASTCVAIIQLPKRAPCVQGLHARTGQCPS
jgi:hypothetical protein